jgi:hypothetical protein
MEDKKQEAHRFVLGKPSGNKSLGRSQPTPKGKEQGGKAWT